MTGILVHEWLATTGGSENVLEEIATVFPESPIICLWDDHPSRFAPGRVHETWLARTPLRRTKAVALFFMPATWRRLKTPRSGTPDWVLSSSHLFSHHAHFPALPTGIPHLAYVHSPARYIWSPELDQRGSSLIARLLAQPLRWLDRHRAQSLHSIAANSTAVAQRIATYWGRDAVVIYPPVDVEFFSQAHGELTPVENITLENLPRHFVLGTSRFIPYKRLDLVIAFGIATNVDVVLAGSGPERARLERAALRHPGRVHFVDHPSRELLRELYRRAEALIFPAHEDFGIMPVEAMAAGTPVVALNRGGTAETVRDGVTGVLLSDFSGEEMRRAYSLLPSLRAADCQQRATDFSTARFRTDIAEWVKKETTSS